MSLVDLFSKLRPLRKLMLFVSRLGVLSKRIDTEKEQEPYMFINVLSHVSVPCFALRNEIDRTEARIISKCPVHRLLVSIY